MEKKFEIRIFNDQEEVLHGCLCFGEENQKKFIKEKLEDNKPQSILNVTYRKLVNKLFEERLKVLESPEKLICDDKYQDIVIMAGITENIFATGMFPLELPYRWEIKRLQ